MKSVNRKPKSSIRKPKSHFGFKTEPNRNRKLWNRTENRKITNRSSPRLYRISNPDAYQNHESALKSSWIESFAHDNQRQRANWRTIVMVFFLWNSMYGNFLKKILNSRNQNFQFLPKKTPSNCREKCTASIEYKQNHEFFVFSDFESFLGHLVTRFARKFETSDV